MAFYGGMGGPFSLISDPIATIWAYLMDQLEDMLKTYEKEIYHAAERILRWFWEGVW